MPTSYLECNRCGLVVERQGWKIQTSGPCEHQAEHGCPGELSKVSGRFQTAFFGPGSWQERAQQPCFCKSLRYLQCNSCGMVRKEQGWHSGDAECEHRHPHGCPGTMCDMTAGGSLAHDPLPEWELQMKQACNCVNPDFTLRIASLAGEILELGVRNDWTIAQAKAKMERVHNISAEHACLSFGGVLLHDSLCIEKLRFNEESPPVSWIRRHPDVVAWLKRVNADWGEIGQAPETIRKSPEVMLAVLHQAHHAISLAGTELLCDAVFLQQACEMRGFERANRLLQPGCL